MKAIAALNEGGRQSMRLFKLAVLFYLSNLAAAVVIVAPLAILVTRDLSRSLESARILSNFDIGWAAEFLYNSRGIPMVEFGALAAVIGALFLLLNTFLAGGAIALFLREKDPFFSSCARFFPRLFRLMLISAPIYAVGLAAYGIVTRIIVHARESSMEAHTWIILHWFQIAFFVFLAGVVNMVFDYAKIVCLTGEVRGALHAATRGLRFAFRNLSRTLTVYWICSGIALAMFLAYHGLSELATQETVTRVALVVALRQTYVLFRIWARLWTWSSEVHVYGFKAPDVHSEPEPAMPGYTFNSTMVAPDPPSAGVAG